MSSAHPFRRFVTRIHRRYIALRIVEQGILGLTMGAVAGLLLVAIALWQGLSTEAVAIATPLLGLGLGFIRGVHIRPTRLEAAMEADRQLALADLLSSASAVSDSAPWAAVVRSQADVVAKRLSPSDVILHRLGARVWGGAGLASALLAVLAVIPAMSPHSEAMPGNLDGLAGKHELTQSSSQPRTMMVQPDSESGEHSQMGNTEELRGAKLKPGFADSDLGHSSEGQAASGRGNASTDRIQNSRLTIGASRAKSGMGTNVSSGSGLEVEQARRADSAGGQGTVGKSTVETASPWKSEEWINRVRTVQSDLSAGHIPDAYRDVIGGYFSSH